MQKRKKIINFLNRFSKLLNLRISNQTAKIDITNFIKELKISDLGYELIRIGPEGDGGYLLPNILNQIEYCFSPGVGEINKFEEHLYTFGIESFLADGTKNRPTSEFQNFDFIKKNLASLNDDRNITLKNWMDEKKMSNNSNLLLQMDIEGSEYEVIHSTPSKYLEKFKILIIEFHNFEQILNEFSFLNIQKAISKILKDFNVCHIHPNNCCGVHNFENLDIPSVLEITFLRKDLVKSINKISKLPHTLDRKHKSKFPDIKLSKNWY